MIASVSASAFPAMRAAPPNSSPPPPPLQQHNLLFNPTYEWASVPPGASVPAGLELRLTLHKEEDEASSSSSSSSAVRLARIPPVWRLAVWVGAPWRCFVRTDAQRQQSIAALEASLTKELHRVRPKVCGRPPELTLTLRDAGPDAGGDGDGLRTASELLAPERTIEEAGLFQRQGRLRVRVRCAAGG